MTAPRLTAAAYVEGVRAGDRATLARAVTLVESSSEDDARLAEEVLGALLPHTGNAHRLGVSGPPGVGKSTLLEALGSRLVDAGSRVAVLAIDPSSTVSGGSILGDKTRMPHLSTHERAFVRPSPSAATLGGVARRTREVLLLCEAAGYDHVVVETVGVGQSETLVAGMVDTFLVLAQPGAGDELQGIKKGILELADVVAVTKADGDQVDAAQRALSELRLALHLQRPRSPAWHPQVLALSAKSGAGLDELTDVLRRHRAALAESGELAMLRSDQARTWLWTVVEERLVESFRADPRVRARATELEARVRTGAELPTRAARELLAEVFGRDAK
jgi:LAO/AO transport system kinase